MFSRLSGTQRDAFGSVGKVYYEALLKAESITKLHKTRIKVFGREENIQYGKFVSIRPATEERAVSETKIVAP